MNNNNAHLTLRASLLGQILSIPPDKRRFFPRVIRARLREIARIDADDTSCPFETCYSNLLKKFGLM